MRAQIVYTVEVEEIPEEVERLKRKAAQLLELSSQNIKEMKIADSVESAIQGLDEVSRSLVTVDLLLRDSSAILQGYLAAKLDPSTLSAYTSEPEDAQ